MILLELTEKEAQMIKNGIIKEKFSWEDSDPTQVSRTLIENNKTHCDSVWAKLDRASQPQQEVVISSKDFFRIKDLAHNKYQELPANVYLSNQKMEERDFVHISIAQSLIMWLNSKNLLKRLAKFDFTDNSCEFEEIVE